MRPRNLAVLFFVVAALGAFIWFVERDLPSTDEREERAKKVLALDENDVVALSIEAGEVTVRLEKEAQGTMEDDEDKPLEWHLVEPLSYRADRYAVERLLTSLTGLEKKRTLEEIHRETYGLDPPEIQVVLVTEEGETTLLVGSELPASGDRVVATGDSLEGYVVSGLVVEDLTKEAGEWRDRDLFHGDRSSVERIRLAHGGQELLLGKRGDSFWVEAPYVDQADEDAVNELLTAFTGLRAERFLDDSDLGLEGLGLTEPTGVLEVVLDDQEKPVMIQWGGAVPDEPERIYARVDNQIVETTDAFGQVLARETQQWRSRRWTSLDAYQLESVVIDEPGEDSLELHRVDADWRRGEDKLAYAPVSDLLYAVTGAEGSTLVAGDQWDAAGARVVLQLFVADDQERREELTLFHDEERGLLGKVSGRDVVLALPAELEEQVLEKLRAVRTAEPLEDESDDGEQG